MAVSDEELEARRQRNVELRAQLEDARAKRVAAENAVANEVAAAELDREAAELELEIAQEDRLTTLRAAREGASTTLAASRAALKRTAAQTKATEKATAVEVSANTEEG